MKTIGFENVELRSGYLWSKQELNRNTTISAVYDRFDETGRIGAFNFDYTEGVSDPKKKPHIFWDSDVAKWMEGAAYIIKKQPDPVLEARVDALAKKIKANQGEDGYFNIYYTVIEPEGRYTDRDKHELYCAGHLMEAAVAYADATGKRDMLDCMEKYADYIYRVFVEEKSAAFSTPGHEEIEIALMKMYLYTKKKKYLELAAFFINTRGTSDEVGGWRDNYNQSHLPVREQTEAMGHAVRAMYLYTGMAMLARETDDTELLSACRTLWENVTLRKMYVTGGIGSTNVGETFTSAYDLPNDVAYAETCAAIGLMFFSNAMLACENDARYADAVERSFYNGVLSGLSLDGESFFYENPLEITLRDKFECSHGKRRLPITQRVRSFSCSCCPPNLNRLLSSLGNYLYGIDGDTLYVNQFAESALSYRGVSCTQSTSYPCGNVITLKAEGAKRVAVRIPGWCKGFELNKPYVIEKGYAVVENDSDEICLTLDMTPRLVYADCRVKANAGRVCVMRGPIVYCAEGVDNEGSLHSYLLPREISATETFDESFGLYTLKIPCKRRAEFADGIYSHTPPTVEDTELKLIPYSCFANRGECDMLVWLCGGY